jgi:hypothetical protein
MDLERRHDVGAGTRVAGERRSLPMPTAMTESASSFVRHCARYNHFVLRKMNPGHKLAEE